tara:strand:- start:242 stop:628 length:387 start_codon:yes stop_codon:yes gene_type:complete
MSEFSNYSENLVINVLLRAASHTGAAAVYVGLYTSDPTDGNTGTEVTGGSYARTAVVFGAPSAGISINSSAVEFPQATAGWGTVGWVGVLDAATSGNLICHSPLDVAKTIDTGDIFKIATGNLSITVS